MAKPPRPYTVTPHGPLENIDENLWGVSSTIPGLGSGHRRMTIVRRSDGSLLFYNAVPVDDAMLKTIATLGTPATLVVPQNEHCIDARAFAERLKLAIHAPRASHEKIGDRFPLAGAVEDLAPDAACRFEISDGVKHGEAVMFVSSGPRVSFVAADVFQNHLKTPFMFRLLGFSGARTPPLFKFLYLQEKEALRTQMQRWASTPNLVRIVPSHGGVMADDPAGILRSAATAL